MEKRVLVAVAAALMSSVGAWHSESVRAADAAASPFEDSTVDASLDPGEKRMSAQADIQARLADLRYAYFIGYNARAREDAKSYATLGDEVKHRQKQVAAPAMSTAPASSRPVAEPVAPARHVMAQAAPPRHVTMPVAAPKREAAPRATPPRQAVAQAEPAPLRRVPVQVASAATPRRVSAPVGLPRQASVRIAPPKRAELQAAPLKQVSVRTTSPKLFAGESEPPILIPTQAVTASPDAKPDNDNDAPTRPRREVQNAQRATSQERYAGEEPRYAAERGSQAAYYQAPGQFPNRQPQQYAAAPPYNPMSAQSQEPDEYAAQGYAPPPRSRRSVQAYQYEPAPYPPARYPPADAQSAYVPRPPAYPAYNGAYAPAELQRPRAARYGGPAQPAGYQGWE